jgi:hypothetical protein
VTFWLRIFGLVLFKIICQALPALKLYYCLCIFVQFQLNFVDCSSFKTGCEAFIMAVVDRKLNQLVIRDYSLVHNHPGFTYDYPENRRTSLPSEIVNDCNALTDLGLAAKPLLEYITKESGKRLTLKDVHNMQAKSKRRRKNEGCDNEAVQTVYVLAADVHDDNDDDDNEAGFMFCSPLTGK